MRIILTILSFFTFAMLAAQPGKVIAGMRKTIAAAEECPTIAPFTSVSNFTESPTGTWTPTSSASDGNAKGPAIGPGGYIQASTTDLNSNNLNTLCVDGSSSISASYYTTAACVVFVYYTDYYVNDGQGGSMIAEPYVDGDDFRLWNDAGTIKAQYNRGAGWVTFYTFSTTYGSNTVYTYMSSATDASVGKLEDVKYCAN